ncbi:uncharacterized protein FPOAC1_013279 [Fusarium poae]|uniref:Chromo shadow domain-containing protein n=1 Tax=Fusarium poae TaxID=36050 RepID=A0A1B8A675_FUSPO|nr:uncharacterized protein FPOAC1_013279 [Fusarium poae]KAG8665300.1 hypothetical protein FPOAC1_013279 [Fusarium poae]OBS15122.1 hypothetical protein FPOA_13996 [Fusarium poae]OBS15972.1 hypothetical protein FPOA_13288 [Fusarium poae]OBS16207.1 hypothetical protein FPOA_13094 [Fusarium poae]OBS16350.1 hypothetical protein FPOA_12984 [Fusarium poae]
MRTRSQRNPSTSLGTANTKSHSARADSLPSVEWDRADVDHMEFDVSTSTYYVFLRWPNGDVSEHSREEAYAKCPQQMLRFYIRHIKLV